MKTTKTITKRRKQRIGINLPEHHAQNGRGVERIAPRASPFLHYFAARVCALRAGAAIRRICFAGALGLTAYAFGLNAAQQTGSTVSRTIEGKVIDRAGNLVPSAVVLIKDLKSLQVRSYIVQRDGKYHFHGLSADANYQLRAQFNGMVSAAKTVSVFESHPTVVLNLKLAEKRLK